ncbi:MAG: HaeII family restriction endonuclease [bacterium]
MSIVEAKQSLDRIIEKARIHLYKPIQIAEILYRDRVYKDIKLTDLETYRNSSKKMERWNMFNILG